ncbi:MAG: XRE family transcriptional regulator [Desulfovibrio sp.]|nr:XRE family transcriptional regulator [Desulfovibrio sp.]
MAKKFSQLRAQMSQESRKRVIAKTDAMLQEMALSELRRARELSQSELARILGIRQPSIADMEKRTDMYISTLRSLIEGMGGQLDIIARFPGQEVRIKNFAQLAE